MIQNTKLKKKKNLDLGRNFMAEAICTFHLKTVLAGQKQI